MLLSADEPIAEEISSKMVLYSGLGCHEGAAVSVAVSSVAEAELWAKAGTDISRLRTRDKKRIIITLHLTVIFTTGYYINDFGVFQADKENNHRAF